MASVSELLLLANLCLSGSVFGFPLHKDTEQTCGYEVCGMFVSFLMTDYQEDLYGNVDACSTCLCRYSTYFLTLFFRTDLRDVSSISVVPDMRIARFTVEFNDLIHGPNYAVILIGFPSLLRSTPSSKE